eukprot:11907548-Alexandrium_andersonii.AAC.1
MVSPLNCRKSPTNLCPTFVPTLLPWNWIWPSCTSASPSLLRATVLEGLTNWPARVSKRSISTAEEWSISGESSPSTVSELSST